ncbi:Alpha-tocopherol transfer protein-like [Eumeta japonica]|uniref:Alpha-tocopherol transfer protein-like n=1 Tax=Eumeta variegata TaxID=151549 RepID=A0A4C1V710_EUMVA|nr:Alpha-tocopherol transfer protein-like [Eumeta japonica]
MTSESLRKEAIPSFDEQVTPLGLRWGCDQGWRWGCDQGWRWSPFWNMAVLKISGNRNLWLWQLNDPGLEKYDYLMDAKVFLLGADAWMLGDEHLEDGDIALMDVKDISLKFITKFNVSVARKLSKFQEEAMPIRLKQVHIVNAPPFIDKLYALMKPFMKQEYINMVHFHPPNSASLYKYIDKDELPNDYGGTAGAMDDLMKRTLKLMLDRRDILTSETFWKSGENKKSKDNKSADDLATGSFRSLAID